MEANESGPVRTCVGCRERKPQSAMARFVRTAHLWHADAGRDRGPGRGAYLCSAECAQRVAKNKRYPGLSSVAIETLRFS